MNDALFEQPDAQPAIALFRQWEAVLNAWGNEVCAFGRFAWGVEWQHQDSSPSPDDCIGLGQQWGDRGLSTHFTLTRGGRFMFNTMWGYTRRSRITEYVPFLQWSHLHGRYQWLIADKPMEYIGYRGLQDWNDRRHYVSEDLLGCRTYSQTNRWVELKARAGSWTIQPALDQGWPGRSERVVDETILEDWVRYEKLIERRYLRYENQARTAGSAEPWGMSERIPIVKAGSKPLGTTQAIDRLLALIQAEQPAKTTRLKRPEEAQHGADSLAPTNQL